jgi:hypothetical protein
LKGLLHLSFVPLTQAVSSGDANAVNSSLASGADVNERTAGGQTALILATIFGHTHLIPVLLKAGADPQLRDNLGLNALDWAQRRGSAEAFDVLTGKSESNSVTRVESRAVSTKREEHSEATEKAKPVSDADRSRRWLAGLQQRIAEQGGPRNLPDGQNIFRQQAQPAPEPPPIPEPEPEIQAVPEVTELALPEEPAQPPPVEEEPAQQSPRKSSGRKRCPKCNAIYNSPLVCVLRSPHRASRRCRRCTDHLGTCESVASDVLDDHHHHAQRFDRYRFAHLELHLQVEARGFYCRRPTHSQSRAERCSGGRT